MQKTDSFPGGLYRSNTPSQRRNSYTKLLAAQLLIIAPVTVATAAMSILLPARWGWMAFWPSVLAGTLITALALAVVLLVAIRSPFDWAGGFVVHLNVGLVVATFVAAGFGFFAVKTLRNTRRNGS